MHYYRVPPRPTIDRAHRHAGAHVSPTRDHLPACGDVVVTPDIYSPTRTEHPGSGAEVAVNGSGAPPAGSRIGGA